MRLSITSDELSLDLNSALEILSDQQCREFEIHSLGLDTVPNVDERWIVQAEKAVQKRLRVTSLAPHFFFDGIPTESESNALFALAKRLKCNLISIFGTKNADLGHIDDHEKIILPSDETLAAMRRFISQAASECCEVAVRQYPETFAGTAAESLELIQAIGADRKQFGLDWDVAQCFAAGDDSGLDSLQNVLPHLKAVRVRDAIRRGTGAEWVSLGKGVIPWEDILEQLYDGGYRGPVILEPGVAPKMKEGRAALSLAARWIGACRVKSAD